VSRLAAASCCDVIVASAVEEGCRFPALLIQLDFFLKKKGRRKKTKKGKREERKIRYKEEVEENRAWVRRGRRK
jgi:hypothetical protein